MGRASLHGFAGFGAVGLPVSMLPADHLVSMEKGHRLRLPKGQRLPQMAAPSERDTA